VSIEELFLRQIDSVDGNIEVIVHPGQPMTCVSTGPFVWQVENVDRDKVIEEIARVMASPMRAGLNHPLRLDSGEDLQIGMQTGLDGLAPGPLLWIISGAAHLRLHFDTASLLIAALCEARQWQRNQLLAAGGEVASC
jgi:hypothetical protein